MTTREPILLLGIVIKKFICYILILTISLVCYFPNVSDFAEMLCCIPDTPAAISSIPTINNDNPIIIPARTVPIFEQFRKAANFDKGALDVAHKLTKRITNVKFVELRKIHYNVMSRVMDMNEADILAGRAKSVSARHYALYELDRLTDAYHHGWQKLGIVISDMLI